MSQRYQPYECDEVVRETYCSHQNYSPHDKRSLNIFLQAECEVITTNTCGLFLLILQSPAPSTRQHTVYTKLPSPFQIIMNSSMFFDKTVLLKGPLLASSPHQWIRLLSFHRENEIVSFSLINEQTSSTEKDWRTWMKVAESKL